MKIGALKYLGIFVQNLWRVLLSVVITSEAIAVLLLLISFVRDGMSAKGDIPVTLAFLSFAPVVAFGLAFLGIILYLLMSTVLIFAKQHTALNLSLAAVFSALGNAWSFCRENWFDFKSSAIFFTGLSLVAVFFHILLLNKSDLSLSKGATHA